MKRAPWLYTLMQIALWSIHGVLISYAQRYLAGMGMRDSAIGLLLGGATAAGFVLQPLLAAVCDRSRLTVRLTLLTGGGLMLLCCAALLPAAKSLTLTAAFYAVACCMAQTVPSFVNALGMAAERKGMRLNFGISRGAGSIGFGLTAQLANVLLLRGGLRTVPLYSLCLAAILTATAFCFPRTAEDAPEAETERASGLGRFLRGSPRFCLLLAGAFLLFFGHNTLASYLYRVAQWKGNADAQGTATMLAALLELPILFGFPFLLRKAGSGVWLRLSGVFFTLRLLLTLVLPGTAGFYLAQCMQMGGFALYTVSSVYYVNEIIPVQDAVKGQSFLGAAGTIGACRDGHARQCYRPAARRRAARRLGCAAAADGLHDCFRRRCGHRVVHRADKKARRLLSSTDFAGRTCYNGATAYPMRVYFPTPARRAGPKMQPIPSDFISEGTFFIWAAPHN